MKLIGSGWKVPSLIDVHNSVTFTLWLCGCNLKCPFCHNWRLAEKAEGCFELDINRLLEELEDNALLIDYLHVTGGEPLLQWKDLLELFKIAKENFRIATSLNTNFTLTRPLKEHLDSGYIDHLATDLKSPPKEMYGVENWQALWGNYLRSLELVNDYDILLELRIPVPKGFDKKEQYRYIEEAISKLKNAKYYVIINPLLNYPVVNPRNKEWCDKHCQPPREEREELKEYLESLGVDNIYIKEYNF